MLHSNSSCDIPLRPLRQGQGDVTRTQRGQPDQSYGLWEAQPTCDGMRGRELEKEGPDPTLCPLGPLLVLLLVSPARGLKEGGKSYSLISQLFGAEQSGERWTADFERQTE